MIEIATPESRAADKTSGFHRHLTLGHLEFYRQRNYLLRNSQLYLVHQEKWRLEWNMDVSNLPPISEVILDRPSNQILENEAKSTKRGLRQIRTLY